MSDSRSKKRPRRWLIRVGYICGVFLLLIVTGEVTARFMGYRAWDPHERKMRVVPEGRFYQDDPLLGFKGKPGTFELTLADSLSWQVTHDAEGWRITSPDTTAQDSLPEIWIIGCSFTHGYGVGDDAHFPARLQALLPQYRVRNYGMDAYGTLQHWLLLRDLLGRGKRPHTVVLAYGAFHDQRNTANRYWRKSLHGQRIADGLQYPFMRLDDRDSLVLHYGPLSYHPLPMQRHLALLALIEGRWNDSEDQGLRSREITQILIQRIAAQCKWVGSRFVLAGIYQHPETSKMLETFHIEGIPTVDISQDLSTPDMRILPGDGHPSAKAHARMAEALHRFLLGHLLDPPTAPQP